MINIFYVIVFLVISFVIFLAFQAINIGLKAKKKNNPNKNIQIKKILNEIIKLLDNKI